MEQQGSGDVVGQVAHHLQRRRAESGKVHSQYILPHQVQTADTLAPFNQFRGKVPVDLNHVQFTSRAQQGDGQRAPAGADLDDSLAGTRVNGPDYPVDNGRVPEKMLAEAPAHGSHENRT